MNRGFLPYKRLTARRRDPAKVPPRYAPARFSTHPPCVWAGVSSVSILSSPPQFSLQIRHDHGQDLPAGQPVKDGFDTSIFRFIFRVIFVMFSHRVLCRLGVVILVITLISINTAL